MEAGAGTEVAGSAEEGTRKNEGTMWLDQMNWQGQGLRRTGGTLAEAGAGAGAGKSNELAGAMNKGLR